MNPINMTCYIKRFWKENALIIFFLVILCGLQVGANLLMMQSFQGIIDRNMRRFIFWMLLLVVIWFFIYGLTGVETFFRCRIIRAMRHNRSVLLVDEGTSALDQENADRIEKNLLSNPELTLILVSHHLSEEQKKRFSQVFILSGAS